MYLVYFLLLCYCTVEVLFTRIFFAIPLKPSRITYYRNHHRKLLITSTLMILTSPTMMRYWHGHALNPNFVSNLLEPKEQSTSRDTTPRYCLATWNMLRSGCAILKPATIEPSNPNRGLQHSMNNNENFALELQSLPVIFKVSILNFSSTTTVYTPPLPFPT
jgi:hypothetical protein